MENDGQLGAQPPAADFAINDEQGNPLRKGLYTLRNKRARTFLDLGSGEKFWGAWPNTNAWIGNQLWLMHHNSENDTYTLKNIQRPKYLEVVNGQNPSNVHARPRKMEGDGRLDQEWRIEELEPGKHTIKGSRTNTFLEIAEGNPSELAKVTCSEAATDRDHQIWILTRVSRTGSEIKAMFESWKPDIRPRIIQPHAEQTEYFVLPHEHRQQLWRDTKLLCRLVRPGMFDHNDFVIKSKEAVSSWVLEQFPVEIQGLSVLFGIMYGETRMGPRAYNWYLSRDMHSLVFFDAQTGEEYGPAALDTFGFEPTSVTF